MRVEMQNKVAVWHHPVTGELCRLCPLVEVATGDPKNPTMVQVVLEQEVAKALAAQGAPANHPYVVMTRDEQPPKEYRSAWQLEGNKIVADVAKAKEEGLARMRTERDQKLLQLDGLELAEQRKGAAGNCSTIHAKKDQLCACTDAVKAYNPGASVPVDQLVAELKPLEVVPEV